MVLEKAVLLDVEDIGKSDSDKHIKFMFNPTEISFSRSIEIEQSQGSRSRSGQNKTSLKHPNPFSLRIGNIILDTYEDGKNVLEHVAKFKRGVEFIEKGKTDTKKQRPPVYLFSWGAQPYMRCFMKSFSFKLTLFLPDGTPVRAMIDLGLEQVDPPTPEQGQGAAQPSGEMREKGGRPFIS